MKAKIAFIIIILITSLAGASFGTSYYVTTSGNDSNTGRSWSAAWRTVDRVNSSLAAGDSVYFGSGRWLDSQIIPPSGGTFSRRTVYACSTLTSTSWNRAQINGGTLVTGWTVYSGNVYRATWTGSNCFDDQINRAASYTLTQNGQLLQPQSGVSNVNGAGKFYHDGTTMYAWLFNNANPSAAEMISSCKPVVWLNNSGQDHILFYGLDIRMGKASTIRFTAAADSVFFVHCNLSRAGNCASNNGAVVMCNNFVGGGQPWGNWNSFVACSLGIADQVPAGGPGGDGAVIYSWRHAYFDSCHFYNLPASAVYWKGAPIGDTTYGCHFGNVVRYSTIDGMGYRGIHVSNWCKTDSIYGNYFSNIQEDGIKFQENTAEPNFGHHFVANNTFYHVNEFIRSDRMDDGGNEVKYNVFCTVWHSGYTHYGFTVFRNSASPPMKSRFSINSNYWFCNATPFDWYDAGTTGNWSTWTSNGFDAQGHNSNPGLNNPVGGDFSRPLSTQEINVTYGGRTWTRMGAWQPTGGQDITPPQINNVRTTDTTSTSVMVRWDTNEPATSQVEYGLTTGYGSTTPLDQSLVSSHVQNVTGLTANTVYHYRVRSRDGAGNEGVSADYTFRTLNVDITPPTISGVAANHISSSSATIIWTTNEPASSQVNYGLTTSYGSSTTLDPTLVTSHSVNLAGLQANTIYHYRARSRDAAGNEAIGNDFNFRTDTVSMIDNIALNMPDTVDSSYPGYLDAKINDGVCDAFGGTNTTWASGESASLPHWIEINFGSARIIRQAKLCWAWNSNHSTWMTSRQFLIQYWNSNTNAYADLITVSNPNADSNTYVTFTPTSTTRLRYFQPANMGPLNYPTILWLTELEIYGSNAELDTIPPGQINDLNALPMPDTGVVKLSQSSFDDNSRFVSVDISDISNIDNSVIDRRSRTFDGD